MIRTAAVVAHFDPANAIDATMRTVLECLGHVCDRTILVTTSELADKDVPAAAEITTIQRPNIGYDFYSYRVGLDAVQRLGGCDRVFLVNSSFVVLDRERFIATLTEMLARSETTSMVGVTQSMQWETHLQSYLLLLDGDLLSAGWFKAWADGLEPRDSKLETILAGELGLARAAAARGVKTHAVLQLSKPEQNQAETGWTRWLEQQGGANPLPRAEIARQAKGFNPTHFAAEALAARCGLAKSELIRDNPHRLDLTWLERATAAGENDEIRRFVERSRSHYRADGSGLTVLEQASSAVPACRVITTGPLARRGVETAVLAHIFHREMLGEICDLVANIVEPFDLIVTTPHEGAIPDIIDHLAPLATCVAVALCENRGRDIGPFMAVHRKKLLEPYRSVLKLHSKKSTYSEQGDNWRQSLYNGLCGSSLTTQGTLALLRSGRVGIVGPNDYYLTHAHFWGANEARVNTLLEAAHAKDDATPAELGFFAGSMFWFNPAALSPLHAIPDDLMTFEPEAGQQDGTLAHAFERIFCSVARSGGYGITSLALGGRDIASTATERNAVPVLAKPEA